MERFKVAEGYPSRPAIMFPASDCAGHRVLQCCSLRCDFNGVCYFLFFPPCGKFQNTTFVQVKEGGTTHTFERAQNQPKTIRNTFKEKKKLKKLQKMRRSTKKKQYPQITRDSDNEGIQLSGLPLPNKLKSLSTSYTSTKQQK